LSLYVKGATLASPKEYKIHPAALIGGDPQHFQGFNETFPPKLDLIVSVGPYTTIDSGTVRPTFVGAGTQIMGHCNIGHDAHIGHDCQIADSVVVAGHAELGNHVRVGIGAMILPYRKVGDHARVGAGAIVTHDVPAYACVAGNPARIISWFCEECGKKIQNAGSCTDCALELAYTPREAVLA
jgi:UDP-N-acetylglucosamine acyltransferase